MNRIDAHVEFSFRGEDYSLSATIDLDQLMNIGAPFSPFSLLAKENGIDTYSYLFEVMEEADIFFASPSGLAVEFLRDGNFDFDAFAGKWRELKILELLRPVARKMGVAKLEERPELQSALLEAYRLGKSGV